MNGLLAGLGMLGAAILAGSPEFHKSRLIAEIGSAAGAVHWANWYLKRNICGDMVQYALTEAHRNLGKAAAHMESSGPVSEEIKNSYEGIEKDLQRLSDEYEDCIKKRQPVTYFRRRR